MIIFSSFNLFSLQKVDPFHNYLRLLLSFKKKKKTKIVHMDVESARKKENRPVGLRGKHLVSNKHSSLETVPPFLISQKYNLW